MQLIDGLKAHLTTLRFYGIFGKLDGMYKVYSVLFLTFFYMPYLIFELIILIENISDLKRVGDSYLMLSHFSTTLKFLTIMVNKKNVRRILDQINSDKFNPFGNNHKDFIETQTKHVKYVFKCFFGVANVTIFFMLVIPFLPIDKSDDDQNFNQSFVDLNNGRKLPFDWSNGQFDVYASPAYEIAYLGQAQIVIAACHICVAIDCFVSGLLHTIATQFDILSMEVKKLGNKEMSCSEVQSDMQKCIRHHINLLDLNDQMSSTFNGIYLTQCCVTSVILCITAFQMNYVTSVIEFITLFSYILCVIFELYLICHYGNKIFLKTGDILPAIYHSNWYSRECTCGYKLQRKHLKTFRQGIHIMMERAKQATNLTAAKLFQLNFATFVTILKSGYSFYAVLNSTK